MCVIKLTKQLNTKCNKYMKGKIIQNSNKTVILNLQHWNNVAVICFKLSDLLPEPQQIKTNTHDCHFNSNTEM